MKKAVILKKKRNIKPYVTPAMLRNVAAAMLPLYRALAHHDKFAQLWSKYVRKADLTRLLKLLRIAAPSASKESLSVNGIGYFVSFMQPAPVYLFMNGTAIPPGKVQFYYEKSAVQKISAAVLPLYSKLAKSRCFANAFARAVRRNDRAIMNRIVRGVVKSQALKSVSIENAGIVLKFKFPNSKYEYEHMLLCELVQRKKPKA